MQRFFLLFKRPLGMIVVNATCAVSGEVQDDVNCLSRRFLTVYDLQAALESAQLLTAEMRRAIEHLHETEQSFVEVDREACVKLSMLMES